MTEQYFLFGHVRLSDQKNAKIYFNDSVSNRIRFAANIEFLTAVPPRPETSTNVGLLHGGVVESLIPNIRRNV